MKMYYAERMNLNLENESERQIEKAEETVGYQSQQAVFDDDGDESIRGSYAGLYRVEFVKSNIHIFQSFMMLILKGT